MNGRSEEHLKLPHAQKTQAVFAEIFAVEVQRLNPLRSTPLKSLPIVRPPSFA